MNHAKIFSLLVFLLLPVYGAIGFYFLPLAAFEGDLTRMAKLPESHFGRTKQQPAIDPKLMESAEWQDADILAIGDSFTTEQVWQTVFAQNGIRVRTESWSTMFNLCEDLSSWIRKQGFKGKHIIIESAEKYLEGRLTQSIACQHTVYHPIPNRHPAPPAPLPHRDTSNYSGSLSVGIQTALNSFKYTQLSDKPGFKGVEKLGEVYLQRVPNGCRLFSHQQCNDVLFYEKDLEYDLGESVIADMQTINERLRGFNTVWMIIPDKATVYLRPNKQFWNLAERKLHAPNLLTSLQDALRKETVDLYLANDTHVSTTGFLLLGNAMYEHIYR